MCTVCSKNSVVDLRTVASCQEEMMQALFFLLLFIAGLTGFNEQYPVKLNIKHFFIQMF